MLAEIIDSSVQFLEVSLSEVAGVDFEIRTQFGFLIPSDLSFDLAMCTHIYIYTYVYMCVDM